jgi:enoyl-CoA hydratase/carnithine racemase
VAKLSKNTLPNQTEKIQGSEGIKVSKEGRIFKIELCRPDKFNALTWSMYEGITALRK